MSACDETPHAQETGGGVVSRGIRAAAVGAAVASASPGDQTRSDESRALVPLGTPGTPAPYTNPAALVVGSSPVADARGLARWESSGEPSVLASVGDAADSVTHLVASVGCRVGHALEDMARFETTRNVLAAVGLSEQMQYWGATVFVGATGVETLDGQCPREYMTLAHPRVGGVEAKQAGMALDAYNAYVDNRDNSALEDMATSALRTAGDFVRTPTVEDATTVEVAQWMRVTAKALSEADLRAVIAVLEDTPARSRPASDEQDATALTVIDDAEWSVVGAEDRADDQTVVDAADALLRARDVVAARSGVSPEVALQSIVDCSKGFLAMHKRSSSDDVYAVILRVWQAIGAAGTVYGGVALARKGALCVKCDPIRSLRTTVVLVATAPAAMDAYGRIPSRVISALYVFGAPSGDWGHAGYTGTVRLMQLAAVPTVAYAAWWAMKRSRRQRGRVVDEDVRPSPRPLQLPSPSLPPMPPPPRGVRRLTWSELSERRASVQRLARLLHAQHTAIHQAGD